MTTAMFESSVATVGLRRLFSFCHRFLHRRTAALALASLVVAACSAGSDAPAENLQAPSHFAGSASCGACHAEQLAAWRESHHALAMQEATPQTVLGDFSGIAFDYFSSQSFFFERDGQAMVRSENAAGKLEEFPVRYTFGVEPLQQYLLELPRGRLQPLTIAWDSRAADEGGQRWFHLYPDEFVRHDDPLHWTGRELNWNYMCAECHSTNLQKNFDLASNSFDTTWSEINVGCEGCHGPASQHVAQMERGAERPGTGLVTDLDDARRAVWQMNPQTGIAERSEVRMQPPVQPEACGRCHARRAVLSEDYEYGRSLFDTHAPVLLEEPLYFPDGQVRDEVYVYGSFLQSRMYQAGVSCSDCHDPHSARLKTGGEPDAICATCHLPQKFASSDHHRHDAGNAGCIDCHMPSRIYMGVDERHDHSFRIPRPDLTVETGSPNACNSCHDDRSADWAEAALRDWYGEDRPAHFATAIHAAQSGASGANDELVEAIVNQAFPGIWRGSALAHLRGPYSTLAATTIQQSLASPDPFVRLGALRALLSLQPELRAAWGGPLLADPLRAVRIEAARIVSPYRDMLHTQFGDAFRAAENELIAAELAISERPEAHMNLGNHFAGAGDAERAEAEFRTALELDAKSIGARVNLADLYRQENRDGEAEQLLREGLEIIGAGAESAPLRYSLGLVLVRNEQQDLALAELRAAAELQPDDPRFVYVYGVALHSTGQSDQAVDILTPAARRFPADFDIHWGLATILRDQGRREEARVIAAGMAERYPDVESVRDLLQSL
jgi:tetratricopeptide (TPR) repeat protein